MSATNTPPPPPPVDDDTPPPPPPPSAPSPAQTRKPQGPGAQARRPVVTLSMTKPPELPPRIVLNAVEGWGKTTFAAHAPGVAMLMGGGETGYQTLLNVKPEPLVPLVPHARFENWQDLIAFLDAFEPNDLRWLALDSLTVFERMCHEFVCARDFKSDWSDKGFASYGKGYEVSVTEWLGLLARLDRIRERHGVGVILLAHSKIKTHKNPVGPDYDRYIADAHEKTWSHTAKWADCVLFGKFLSEIAGARDVTKKGKGIGGDRRVVHTQQRDAYDAKNRFGMPESIEIPSDHTASFSTVMSFINPE